MTTEKPDDANCTAYIGVWVPPELKTAVESAARADDRSLSSFVRRLLEAQFVEKPKRKGGT